MCGICGIYGTSDEALVARIVTTLRHRGPDDSGIYVDDTHWVTIGIEDNNVIIK